MKGKRKAIRKEKGPSDSKSLELKISWHRPCREVISRHPHLFAFLLISFAASLLYVNSIHNEFVFDDIPLIVRNRSIRSFENLPEMIGLTSGVPHYRPIREISYLIDYQMTGLNPVGYHLMNIFYHILTSFLVFLIASLLAKNKKVALAAALIFVSHPIQTESVTYIAGRRDILCALFFFLGFFSFLRFRESKTKGYLFLFFLSYVLSIFTKEMGVTLPAIVLLYDLIWDPSDQKQGTRVLRHPPARLALRIRVVLRNHWVFYLSFFVVALLFTFYKVVLKNPSLQKEFYGGSILSNFLTVLNIWVFYIRMMIFPVSLNVAHSFPISQSILEFRTLISLILLVSLFVLLVNLLKRRSLYSFCGFWFFVTLLPVSHIFPHHELVAEHYLYLPCFGFSLTLGLLTVYFSEKDRWKPFPSLVLSALLLFYSYQTVNRNRDWKNYLTLWSDAAKKSPENVRARTNLVAGYIRYRLYDRAIMESLDMLREGLGNYETHQNLGLAYWMMGKSKEAMEQYRRSIEMRENNPKAYMGLGTIWMAQRDPDRAIEAFRKAVAFQRRNPTAHDYLAQALAMKGWVDEAILEEVKATRIAPEEDQFHFNLARLYEKKGEVTGAIKEHKEALRLNEKHVESRLHLGLIYANTGNYSEAVLQFEEAIRRSPRSWKIYLMLADVLATMGDKEKGIVNLEKAIQYAPDEKEKERIESIVKQLRSGAKPGNP